MHRFHLRYSGPISLESGKRDRLECIRHLVLRGSDLHIRPSHVALSASRVSASLFLSTFPRATYTQPAPSLRGEARTLLLSATAHSAALDPLSPILGCSSPSHHRPLAHRAVQTHHRR